MVKKKETPIEPDLSRLHEDVASIVYSAEHVAGFQKEHTELVNDRVETSGYNRAALSVLVRLERMTPERRMDFRRTFDAAYEQLCQKWDQADTPDMFDAA